MTTPRGELLGFASGASSRHEITNLIAEYVYAARPTVPDYIVKDGVTYRVLTDHVGSVRLVVDASTGAIAQRIDYDEFGNIQVDSAPGFQPFGFAGGLYDSDTGLVRFGARDYDPVTGRWTSRDPIGFESGTNLYLYAGNDPVNNVDLSGLDWVQDFGDFAAGFGDTISFGLTRRARQALGVDGAVGYCSGFYTAGSYTSIAIDIASGVKGAVGVVKWGSRTWRGRSAARAAIAPRQLIEDTAQFGSTPLGRPYTYHYGLETGPTRNIPGSVVDEAIDYYPGKQVSGGKTVHYDPNNNVTVVTGRDGAIVSVHKGPPRAGQR